MLTWSSVTLHCLTLVKGAFEIVIKSCLITVFQAVFIFTSLLFFQDLRLQSSPFRHKVLEEVV